MWHYPAAIESNTGKDDARRIKRRAHVSYEMPMFRLLEKSLLPTSLPEGIRAAARAGGVLLALRAPGASGLFIGLFAAGFAVALLDVTIPVFIGKVVTLVTTPSREELLAQVLAAARRHGGVLLIARPAAFTTQHLLMNQAIAANVANRIRWQNHWHVVRQSWAFFQNDFAGRIANRVMQTGPAIRESLWSRCSPPSGSS